MQNPLPILLAGAATLLLLGGKKKKSPPKTEQTIETQEVPGGADLPSVGKTQPQSLGYGIVENGIRKDRRGHYPWRVYYDADGYHAQIMLDNSKFAPVQEEVGIAASSGAAKSLLRNRFNELLLGKYPKEKPKNDPEAVRSQIGS